MEKKLIYTGKTKAAKRACKFRKMLGIFAPNLGDNRAIRRGDF